jgi:hypothetical protein
MWYMFELLVALAVTVAVALGPAFAQDGPSVCQYRDGTVLNVGGGMCVRPPWFERAPE